MDAAIPGSFCDSVFTQVPEIKVCYELVTM